MNILITSAGRRVSLLKAFQKELKAQSLSAKIFASDSNPELSAACMVADGWFKVPKLDNPNFIRIFIEKCKANNISLVIPTIDTELSILSQNHKLFLENNIEIVISSVNFINICRDKRKTHEFFINNGISVAKEYSINNLSFPIFAKPYDGSGSMDAGLLENEKDMRACHYTNKKFMFLQYINGQDNTEYTCDLYYGKDSKLKCIIPRKRIKVRDGEVIIAKTENNVLVDFIKTHLSFIEGARGCLTTQFFLNNIDNTIVGNEINARFGGGYPLTYLAGGNFPRWIIDEYFFNKSISYFEGWQNNMLMLRYDDEIIIENYEE